MTEMIAAEPALAERLITRLADDEATRTLADWLAEAVVTSDPIEVFGCGTSEHAAEGAAEIWTDALRDRWPHPVRHRQALDVIGRPTRGIGIGISHEGGTAITNAALAAVRDGGGRTALITVSGRSPGAAIADLVIATEEQDQSWCHTVGYLSPILAAAAVGAAIAERPLDTGAVRALLAADTAEDAEAIGRACAEARHVIVAGAGADHANARELALKIAEGAHLPTIALDLETVLHGHLAAADPAARLIVVGTDDAGQVVDRTRAVVDAARAIGIPAAAILTEPVAATLTEATTPAGRIVVGTDRSIPPAVARLIAPVTPMQLVAERLARARHVNPDTLGREEPRQATAQ